MAVAHPLLCPRPFPLLEMNSCLGGCRSSLFSHYVEKYVMMDGYLDQDITAFLLGSPDAAAFFLC